MARYLTPEWVQSFDAALSALDLTDAIAAAGEGSLAAGDGTFTVAQIVTDLPDDADNATGTATLLLTIADGHAHLTLDDPVGFDSTGIPAATAPVTATIVLGYDDARALALGQLDAADALAAGRVRVRGDLAALVAGQQILNAASAQLGPALDDLTDPAD